MKKYYGYCFSKDGSYNPPVTLNSPKEVYKYLSIHGHTGKFNRVIATDTEDCIIAEIIDGKFTYPPQWAERFN
ncbi:hypothetical protein Psfp_04282 [Pelotomaculum sp. FP]|uniref:hypothetical protein n=1 Tax=Pelotomaculum sp. FP TaxID=261474 RepID=UPI001064AEA5|nr:hypothetical protein [Pelotomaculum sp. FP]TEB09335.1 hypothetical protein Psfp_04282 [Pelotomaculum sp. FP]